MPLQSLDQRRSCHIPIFFFFCNEMQQMCNLVGKHTTASRYDLGGQSLTAAFN